ncbi:hypothetical protein LDENG_00226270, partial [Lucifuga dentata]
AVKATDQPVAAAGAADPDPAETWKKDFQCQWFKTSDGAVSDQQPPKDGAPAGGAVEEKAGDVSGTMVAFTTKGASVAESGSSSPGSTSPTPLVEEPTDCGRKSGPNPTSLLLLLLALNTCLDH